MPTVGKRLDSPRWFAGHRWTCADGELKRPGGLRGWWIRPAPASTPHGSAGNVDSHSSVSAPLRAASLSSPSDRV
jgi:hypothetical protein